MQLHYRGAAYEPVNNAVEGLEGEIIGKYRGVPVRQHQFRNLPAQAVDLRLTYRGAQVK
ncbi:MAG: hypothetical protein Fur0046_23340 [Cyanobacteria bacterium J069]|nr:MAG: DUF4278 domain-containing protein [Cyanobacteria bacterium J069]